MGIDEMLLIKMPSSVLFIDSCGFSVWGEKKVGLYRFLVSTTHILLQVSRTRQIITVQLFNPSRRGCCVCFNDSLVSVVGYVNEQKVFERTLFKTVQRQISLELPL